MPLNFFRKVNMGKELLFTIIFVFFVQIGLVNAQTYEKTDLGIKSIINSIEVEIQFYNPSTVRVLKSPEGKTFEKQSLSVIEAPQKTDFTLNQNDDELFLQSKDVQVSLNLKSGKISFSTPEGESLLNEKINLCYEKEQFFVDNLII